MWPFTKTEKKIPSILVNGVVVKYDEGFSAWSYNLRDYDFYYYGHEFNVDVIEKGLIAVKWIDSLKDGLRLEVIKNLEGWVKWDGIPTILSVDVTDLINDNKIYIAFIGDETWGDLGINVVVKSGLICDSYSGD